MEEDNVLTVTIPLERFEELIDIEARQNVLTEYLKNSDYCNKEIVLRIIGTYEAVIQANKIRMKEQEEEAEYKKKYFSNMED